MLILININILAMVLDLMWIEVFRCLNVLGMVEVLLYFVHIWFNLYILIIRKDTSWFLVRVQGKGWKML